MTRSTRFTTLLLMLSLILLPQTSQGAQYRITVLATNISDYGGLGEWSFALFRVSKMQFYSIPALKGHGTPQCVASGRRSVASPESCAESLSQRPHRWLADFAEAFSPKNEMALSQVYVAAGFFDQRTTAAGGAVGPGNFASAKSFKTSAEAGIGSLRSTTYTDSAKAMADGPVPRVKVTTVQPGSS